MSEQAQATTHPNITIHRDVEQGTEAWMDLRRGVITASAIGKLITPTLKVADNETSRGLALTLAAERLAGFTEDTPMNADMFRGVLCEPIARAAYTEHNKTTVDEVGFVTRSGDGWLLGYSPDGLIGDEGLLEVKSPRSKTHVRTILADEVPAQHVAQCQAGLFVTGRSWLDFVSFCGGMPLFTKRIYPDPDWFRVIEEACVRLESDVQEIVDDYEPRVIGLPMTERFDLEIEVA